MSKSCFAHPRSPLQFPWLTFTVSHVPHSVWSNQSLRACLGGGGGGRGGDIAVLFGPLPCCCWGIWQRWGVRLPIGPAKGGLYLLCTPFYFHATLPRLFDLFFCQVLIYLFTRVFLGLFVFLGGGFWGGGILKRGGSPSPVCSNCP